METKKEHGIFENVQFLDEGVGAVIFGLLALPYILIGTCLIVSEIDSKIDKNRYESNKKKIKKAMIRLEKNDKYVAGFKRDIGSVKYIDAVHLLRAIGKNVGEKEANILKTHSTECAIIYDKQENIVAYAMIDLDNGKCAYNIMNSKYKSNDEVKHYIMATLENKLNIIGDGIKWFEIRLKKVKYHHGEYNTAGTNNALIVSPKEYKDNLNKFNSIVSKFKALVHSTDKDIVLSYENAEGEFCVELYFDNKFIKAAEDDYDEYSKAWDEHYDSFNKSIDNIISKFNQANKDTLSKYEFHIEEDWNPDENGCLITIYHNKGYKSE